MTHHPFSRLKIIFFFAVLCTTSFSKSAAAEDKGEASISKRVVSIGPAEKETLKKLKGFQKRFKSRAKKDLATIKEDMMKELGRLRKLIHPEEQESQKEDWALGEISKLIMIFGIRLSDQWSDTDYRDIETELNRVFLGFAKEADAKQGL
jgi:hypothetical protein